MLSYMLSRCDFSEPYMPESFITKPSPSLACPEVVPERATFQYRCLPSFYMVAAWPWSFCSSCTCKKMRPTLLCNGESVACASSFNPRMAFGQSVAQPEPRTPCAPNSNRCQSVGYHRQLVYVRMSPNTITTMLTIPVTVYAGVDVAKATLQ